MCKMATVTSGPREASGQRERRRNRGSPKDPLRALDTLLAE